MSSIALDGFRDIVPVSHLDFDEQSKGFETAVPVNLRRYLSIMGGFSAHFSSNQFPVPIGTTTQDGTINPRLFNILAGPEIKWRNRTRIALLPTRSSALPTSPQHSAPPGRLLIYSARTRRRDLRWHMVEDSTSVSFAGPLFADS